MRYQQWRLLWLRSYQLRSHLVYPSQVTSVSTRSFSSPPHRRPTVESRTLKNVICGDDIFSIEDKSSPEAIEDKSSPEAIDIFSIEDYRSLLLSFEDKSSPEAIEDKSSPEAIEDKSSPEAIDIFSIEDFKSLLLSSEDKSSPEAIEDKSSPEAIEDKSSPEAIDIFSIEDFKSLLLSSEDKSSPEAIEDKSSPEAIEDKSSPEAIEDKSSPEDIEILIDIFSRLRDNVEIRKELASRDMVISHDLALKVLRKLESNPDVADKFFSWIVGIYPLKITPEYYDKMRTSLGNNPISRSSFTISLSLFPFWGGRSDRREERYKRGLACDKVCEIVMKEEWGDDVEKRVRDLNIEFESYLVKMILETLDSEPRKALSFFRWIDQSGLFEHDSLTYNAVARVVGNEEFLDSCQEIVGEMKSAGYHVDNKTYERVSKIFCQANLVKEAVDLFELAVAGVTSSSNEFRLLLQTIVTANVLDMDLFTRAVKISTINGTFWKESGTFWKESVSVDIMLRTVFEVLESVDRVAHSFEVLKALKKGGYVPSVDTLSWITTEFWRKGMKDEADELVAKLHNTEMASLVKEYLKSGEFEQATVSFEKMVGQREWADDNVFDTFQTFVLAYCNKNRARDAYKFLSKHVKEIHMKPRHDTYRTLVSLLLREEVARDGGFEEALSLIPMMKKHCFTSFVEHFLIYFSTFGKSTEALCFLKALNSENLPSTPMALRLFEAMLNSARQSEARDLLSMCPDDIRNHPDVVELFSSMKPNESSEEQALPPTLLHENGKVDSGIFDKDGDLKIM